MTEYWAAVYARDKTYAGADLRWRLRDMEDHPCDPGWERGDCSVCHQPIREEAEPGDVLFDIVFPRGAKSNAPRVVRSAMPIEEADEGCLQFDSFLFLDGDWRDGVPAAEGETEFWSSGAPLWRGRGAVTEGTAVDWLEEMSEGAAYTTYEAEQRPESIPEGHWKEMIRRCPLSEGEEERERCPPGSDGDSGYQRERTCYDTC